MSMVQTYSGTQISHYTLITLITLQKSYE